MQETWVPPLVQKGPLEEEIATHSSILTWEIPQTGTGEDTIHRVAKEPSTT